MLLISVVTVSFNSVSTLSHALQSVVDQDWPNVQHILIDGASTDGTLQVIESYVSHLSCVVSEPDLGIYDAMNKGLELVKGDVVCFLNSDDYYSSAHVLSKVAHIMQHYQLDALYGDVSYFDPINPSRMLRHYRSDRFTPERMAWGWMPAHPALFLRREVVKRVGHFNTNYKIAGDFDFIARVFYGQNLRYRHLPDVLVNMQTGGVSTSGIRSKILLNQEVLRSCRENGIPTNLFKILSKYPIKLLELFV